MVELPRDGHPQQPDREGALRLAHSDSQIRGRNESLFTFGFGEVDGLLDAIQC